MYELRAAYLACAGEWCAKTGVLFEFPLLRAAYYDGDSWVWPIRHPILPDNIVIRHRLWTIQDHTAENAGQGQVDMIFRDPSPQLKKLVTMLARDEMVLTNFGAKNVGVQVSYLVPEIRQLDNFNPKACHKAMEQALVLLSWYLGEFA